MKKILVITALLLNFTHYKLCSQSTNRNAVEILDGLHGLKVLGSVLYVAAHPDDENTRLITALSKKYHMRTAYISLTRGDGGQNLIGSELDELLGVIRTNELLQARNIDGGIQYFSRANDFGYSKNAEETFQIWEKDSVLFDLVKTIRTFKPDIIINRFDHRTSGKTHGHHTASAMLAMEAFNQADNPLFMADHLSAYEPLSVKRIFFNTSWFFYGSKEKFDQADKSNLYKFEVGDYLTSYGKSASEIAAQSRSMHKSQGFGINSSRGSQLEYLERLDAKKQVNEDSPFDNLDLSWNRINGGGNINSLIDQAITSYDISHPENSIPLLQKIEKYIFDLSPSIWKDIKLNEVRQLIYDCAGIYALAFVDQQIISPEQNVKINTEVVNRSSVSIILDKIELLPNIKDSSFSLPLKNNISNSWSSNIQIPKDIDFTAPFWLKHGRGKGLYKVDNLSLSNKALSPHTFVARFNILINNIPYKVEKDVVYKNDDPVLGEIIQTCDIIPDITAKPFDQVLIANVNETKKFHFTLSSTLANRNGTITFRTSAAIKIKPSNITINFDKANEDKLVEFEIQNFTKSNKVQDIEILFNGSSLFTNTSIKYAHIPWQNVLLPAKIKLCANDIKINKRHVSYVEGAGDYIDEALTKMGFEVEKINPATIRTLNPKTNPVLIFGIRAFNTQSELANMDNDLKTYVENGGHIIIQYNTTAELLTNQFAGNEIKISRDRVTNENASVEILIAQHPLLNKPNKIQAEDFDYWVQERGLYFPNNYDSGFQELLAMGDPNETKLKSGILYKKMGKGSITYTSMSWFRQLPAAVPGAYRLFANLISN